MTERPFKGNVLFHTPKARYHGKMLIIGDEYGTGFKDMGGNPDIHH